MAEGQIQGENMDEWSLLRKEGLSKYNVTVMIHPSQAIKAAHDYNSTILQLTIHVDVEMIAFEAGGIGASGIEGGTSASAFHINNSFFKNIFDGFGVLFREPSVEGRDSHAVLISRCQRRKKE